jgi:hypothetical protein
VGVGRAAALGLAPVEKACVLLVDGLGWQLLRAHRDHAPYLASLLDSGRPLSAGFPATTATSLGSLGTGLPPGAHGLLGYEVAVPGEQRVLNALRWDTAVDPVAWQPTPTLFERIGASGVTATQIGPHAFQGSGLTTAALRGGRFVGAESAGERVAAAHAALREPGPALVYVYYGELDATGHRNGCGSPAWRLQLEHVDRLVAQLAAGLPAGSALWVTGDHGMVDVPPQRRVDLADEPGLSDGVRLLAGEARARYVHTVPGAQTDVLAAWRERLGESMWVVSRAEAVDAGWFGPSVAAATLDRIGDIVAAAHAPVAVVDSRRERPELISLIGLHGSLTDAEQLVPLLEVRPR